MDKPGREATARRRQSAVAMTAPPPDFAPAPLPRARGAGIQLFMDGETPAEPGQIDAEIARSADRYDAIPYTSKPFPQTHPNRLAGIARMFGLDTPLPSAARVLEIGCAGGGNLIPLAVAFPHARFLGIDLSPVQVAQARERIARAGLTNIEVQVRSLTDMKPEDGLFDFIISHGVYSWVPEEVQKALLRLSCRNLAPDGIAYVSYNVLPGWRMWQAVRDAFLALIPAHLDAVTRLNMAKDLLVFLRDHCPDKGHYGQAMRGAWERLKDFPDDYLAHEYLEDAHEPLGFRDFIVRAQDQGLDYLGEADLALMFPGNYGREFAGELLSRTSSDIVSVEQMLDVLTGRTFRQTLLVHKERTAAIRRQIAPQTVERVHALPGRGMRIEKDGPATRLIDESNRVLGSRLPSVGKAIERIVAAWPGSVSLDDLAVGLDAQGRLEVADAMMRLIVTGMAVPLAEPVRAGRVSARPRALAIARFDVSAGLSESANLRHDAVRIDPASMVLLPLLDGRSSRDDLAAALLAAARDGRIEFKRDGVPVTEPRALREISREAVPNLLRGLEWAGLLEP